MEQSIIYVQSLTGKPLMPTRRRNKVWCWLRKGLAEVVHREPFTKGAFVLKDLVTGKPILEVTPRKLRRLARPTQGWIIHREEVRASSPA
jgi:hypothetical protein